MVDAGQRIAGALTPNGWTLDPQYAADSPTGTMHGLRRNNQLAVYNVQWAPPPASPARPTSPSPPALSRSPPTR